MTNHYVYEPDFCNPAAGWEKGQVEKNVRDSRHQMLQGMRDFLDLAALNAWLELRCLDLWRETAHGTLPGTIAVTKRGAIEGLLPHGPHNVRDVLATHILKRTGSYEQASYAIQDTPDMVAQHCGRFLPQDKSEIAARILNQVWEAA